MKIPLPRLFDLLAVLAIVAVVAINWGSGSGAAPAPTPGGLAGGNTAVRVEIQRYMGYEMLPVRYLSLPYDLTMNTNEQLALLDTGFLLLIFVPILVLLGLKKQPLLQWVVLLSCLVLLVISTANGFLYGTNLEVLATSGQTIDQYLTGTTMATAPVGVVVAQFYRFFTGVYSGLSPMLAAISGDRDAVTYPLLLAVFVLFFYVSAKRFADRPLHEQGLFVLLFGYIFFWLILSSGIVWYGFLAFPVLTALVFWSVPRQVQSGEPASKALQYGFYALFGLAVLMGFAQRFSNIKLNIVQNDSLAGRRIYDPAYLRYQTGEIGQAAVTEAFYPGLSLAVEEINRDPRSLIYNVGTRFNFFIRENDRRIFKDNQLDLFNQVQTKYPSKERITAMLKGAGFRFILVDLNTPTADKTPEQSLVNKYKNFMLLLYNNPGIELVATNRVLKETINGKEQYKYGIFGEAKEMGSYAVFRIK